jgi:hypothetical protein
MPLALLVIAFKLWMLVDALQRRADYYWFMIIILVPGGSLLNLFLVRMPAARSRPPSPEPGRIISIHSCSV